MSDDPLKASSGHNSDDDQGASSAAEILLQEILNGDYDLFHDQRLEPYLCYRELGVHTMRIGSDEFGIWLARKYWQMKRKPLPNETESKVTETLAGYARFEGIQMDLHIRYASNDDGLWYDLGNGTAVNTDRKGWRLVGIPPVLFRRLPHQKHQVIPEHDADISRLRPYINLSNDDDWLLFLVNLISVLIPGFPHPLLVLYGPQGAGKSTPMRVMKELLDPSQLQGLTMPNQVSELVQQASHHGFIFYDNLSGLKGEMSDALARASTGDGFSKRTLYTDDGDFIYVIQRSIALNGINQVITRPDLLDRSILIKLERINPEARLPEEEYWAAFNREKPYILGAMFDVLSDAMNLKHKVQLDKTPRMADFARWGCAIAVAAGYTQEAFLKAYFHNIGEQHHIALEASPVAQAVIMLMKTQEKWSGTATELLSVLNDHPLTMDVTKHDRWPKNAVWMSRQLNIAEVNLAAIGIHIKQTVVGEGRVIHIFRSAGFDKFIDETTAKQTELLDNDDSIAVNTVSLDF